MSVFIYNRGLILCCTLALQLINIKVRHFAGNKYKYEYTRTFAFIKPWTGLDCRQPKLANLNLYNPVSLYFEFNDNVITLKCRIISMAVLFLFWPTCKTQVCMCVCLGVVEIVVVLCRRNPKKLKSIYTKAANSNTHSHTRQVLIQIFFCEFRGLFFDYRKNWTLFVSGESTCAPITTQRLWCGLVRWESVTKSSSHSRKYFFISGILLSRVSFLSMCN